MILILILESDSLPTSMNLFHIAFVLLATTASAACHHQIRGSILFYLHTKSMTGAQADDFCETLAGILPYQYTRYDVDFLAQLRIKVDAGFWLNGHKDGEGYHWGGSAGPVPADMWLQKQPNCEGDCGIIFGKQYGGYGLVSGSRSSFMYPLCVIDTTHEKQVSLLQAQLSTLDEADRIGMAKILASREKDIPTTTPEVIEEKEPEVREEPSRPGLRIMTEPSDRISERMSQLERKVDAIIEFIRDPSNHEMPIGSPDAAIPRSRSGCNCSRH